MGGGRGGGSKLAAESGSVHESVSAGERERESVYRVCVCVSHPCRVGQIWMWWW